MAPTDDSALAPLLPTSNSLQQSNSESSSTKVSKVYIPIGGALLSAAAIAYMLFGGTSSSNISHRFPSYQEVGHAGPTPTGFEALAAQTAYPVYHDTSPLNPPSSLFPSSDLNFGKNESFNILHSLGNLSPWRTVNHGLVDSSPQVPDGCQLEQVQLLHRHGARYPTSDTETSEIGNKLMNAKNMKATGPLSFLNGWKYKLGAEILTPFGRAQLFNLGVKFRVLYGQLLADDIANGIPNPTWRTTSQDRMYKSAANFAAGFFGIPYEEQYNELIMIEDVGFNNTLAPYMTCPNSARRDLDSSKVLRPKWLAKYLKDALPRIQKHVEGLELTIKDMFGMQEMCAYELVALGGSSFCDLFTAEEWKGFEYANDLAFWYGSSYGNPAQSAIGLGWVQEWLARVTKVPIVAFDSSTNSSYHTEEYFPLEGSIFVDATHDTIISAIITTLNLPFARSGALPFTHIPEDQSFIVSSISPFSANLHSQILSCSSSETSKSTRYVRWILNDGVVPLENAVKGCGVSVNGMCELETFVKGLQDSISDIDWEYDCFAPYELGDQPILNGRPPKH